VDINSAVGRKAGLSDEKLLAIPLGDLGVFTDVEPLVTGLADAMAAAPANVAMIFTRGCRSNSPKSS